MRYKLSSIIGVCLFAQSLIAGDVIRLRNEIINVSYEKLQLPAESHNTLSDYIVQFNVSPTEVERHWLKKQVAEVFNYLPDDSYAVRASGKQINILITNKNLIKGILNYKAQYKLSPSFAGLNVFNSQARSKVIVQLFSDGDLKNVLSSINSHIQTAQVEIAKDTTVVLNVANYQILKLASITGVEHIQPFVEMKTMEMTFNENLSSMQEISPFAGDYKDVTGFETGTKLMNFESAWSQGFSGQGQIVSMADTGLDSGQVETLSEDFQSAVMKGYKHGLFSKSWADPMGHGTHVAGSVMGRGTYSGGLFKGGAHAAQFIPNGMWSPMLNNLSIPSQITDLFTKPYADGARVHTNSWGSPKSFGEYDTFAMKVDDYIFKNPDILILFAAGNSGVDKNKDGRIDANSIGSPGTAKNVLTVGASENVLDKGGIQVPLSKLKSALDSWPAEPIYSSRMSDNINGLAMFSSRGPTVDGRTKPDLVGPGTNILSARSHESTAEDLWGKYNEHYVFSGGTSMSTPLVAGAAVLARQYLVEKAKLSNPSSALLKALLVHRAVDMFPGQYGLVGAAQGQELLTERPNTDQGFGRVDVKELLQLNNTSLNDNRIGISQGESQQYIMKVPSSKKVTVTLVWNDAPASANAASSLVNDLDITVQLPSGQVRSLNDHINNIEMIEIKNAEAGTYKISVNGLKIPQGNNGKQPYALIYSFQ